MTTHTDFAAPVDRALHDAPGRSPSHDPWAGVAEIRAAATAGAFGSAAPIRPAPPAPVPAPGTDPWAPVPPPDGMPPSLALQAWCSLSGVA